GDLPTATIIGGDQTLEADGRLFDKPGDRAAAAAQLKLLSGRTHRLFTAVAVWRAGAIDTRVDVSTITFRRLSDDAIARYLDADEPYDCCGSYRIESGGLRLMAAIETTDPSAIVGLPLIALADVLSELGWPVP
ncbi:MAG: Maf family protein, partial [Planctomycetia bacterium]